MPAGTHMEAMRQGAYAGKTNDEIDYKRHKDPLAMCRLKCQLAILVENRSPNKDHIMLFDDLEYVTTTLSSKYPTYTVKDDMTTHRADNKSAPFICQWPQHTATTLEATKLISIEPRRQEATLSMQPL